jgi:hypothetical protein
MGIAKGTRSPQACYSGNQCWQAPLTQSGRGPRFSIAIAMSDRSLRSLQGQSLSMPPIRATTKDSNIL